MNMLLKSLISIFMIAFASLISGEGYLETERLKIKADFIRSDELGNVFAVKDNTLVKFDTQGKKLHNYSNTNFGDISFIDTHDPFKILLFYESFGQILFLDQSLSLASSVIDLNMLDLGLSSLVCSSYQGAFWVYDPGSMELIRVNQNLEISERSGNLQQVTGLSPDPNYMLERDNFLYLNDPEKGILIFDKYGSYYKTIPVTGLESFQVFNGKIIFYKGDEISIYDTKLNELSTTSLPRGDAVSVSVCMSLKPQRLYMLSSEELFFYFIK